MKNKEFVKELKEMTVPTLLKELDKINNDISLTRAALSFGKEKNTKKILNLRKNRARIWGLIFKNVSSTSPQADEVSG